jgi:hypothetical protein
MGSDRQASATTGTIPGHATHAACSVARASSVRWMVEGRCITTKCGGLQGWIAIALPGPVRPWLGFTMATHCDHATNMSITSQLVSIVERLVGRHSPAR